MAGGDAGATAWVGDLFNPSDCPVSNVGEIYYSGVPDQDNVAGTKARERADVVDYFPHVIAHEFTHLLQYSARVPTGSPPLSAWEAEGQAELGSEIVGHRMTGLMAGQDYDSSIALTGAGEDWYESNFVSLATYYGYDGGTYSVHDVKGERRPDAPETCTLLFNNSLATNGCVIGSGYGAAWSFFRYLADRYRPSWPGGEAGFMQDWLTTHPALSGAENVEALLGRPFTEAFAEWAAMQYLDGRVAGADPSLLMGSWDLHSIMPAIAENAPLLPTARTFSSMAAELSIRGGSTAYSLFTDAAPRPATAIRVRDSADEILGTGMEPHLWVVRAR